MGKTLLVIGGTGLISTAVVKAAVESGIKVTVLNRGHNVKRIPEGVELIKSDVNNEDYVRSVLAGRHFDAVTDFICYDRGQLEYSLSLFAEHTDQYILISSACVYDMGNEGVKDEDSQQCFASWDYSVNKSECEKLLLSLAGDGNFNYTIVRPCITFDDSRIPYDIMPQYGFHWTLIERIKAGKPVVTCDGGKARWSMMRVEDFASAFVLLVGNERAYGQAVNISGDEACSWGEVLSTVAELAGCHLRVFDVTSMEYMSFSDRKGEIAARSRNLIADNSKLKGLTDGYVQRMSVREGVRMTFDAYLKNGFQKGIDWAYDAECDYVIRRVCRIRGTIPEGTKIGFVNYLHSAGVKGWLRYQLQYRRDWTLVTLVRRLLKL